MHGVAAIRQTPYVGIRERSAPKRYGMGIFTAAGEQVALPAECGPLEVVCRVIDTGPGRPPDALDRLFERPWRAHRSDRRGIGLGLTIAKGLVKAHGGLILPSHSRSGAVDAGGPGGVA